MDLRLLLMRTYVHWPILQTSLILGSRTTIALKLTAIYSLNSFHKPTNSMNATWDKSLMPHTLNWSQIPIWLIHTLMPCMSIKFSRITLINCQKWTFNRMLTIWELSINKIFRIFFMLLSCGSLWSCFLALSSYSPNSKLKY